MSDKLDWENLIYLLILLNADEQLLNKVEEKGGIIMSKLQGWDYINSLIGKCPICGQRGTLGQPANTKQNVWRVCCMTSNCSNSNITQNPTSKAYDAALSLP